ncbi:hypothetical protein BWQ96_06649 [Gracilariopsis chorda]|uniref:Peptidoglycan binding-like domain-containing protein n=1 Tax=Gracilariopsis chorda TaxID=448386 RepID=A0A2V3IND8_9FLOR|nr:hypothetical protein BWQ96_06649 [Gracilariopsis chorda]|eukprot:PXF43592.1 hypothetical protein BWQ96_06649 [Gracilariopsis chorda]
MRPMRDSDHSALCVLALLLLHARVTHARTVCDSRPLLKLKDGFTSSGREALREQVRELQQLLIDRGYPSKTDKPFEIDGLSGKMTKAAVEEYQTDHGLLVDAKVGDQTWASLCRDTDSSTPHQPASTVVTTTAASPRPSPNATDAQPAPAPVSGLNCSKWTVPTEVQRIPPFETILSSGPWDARSSPIADTACMLGFNFSAGTRVRVEAHTAAFLYVMEMGADKRGWVSDRAVDLPARSTAPVPSGNGGDPRLNTLEVVGVVAGVVSALIALVGAAGAMVQRKRGSETCCAPWLRQVGERCR